MTTNSCPDENDLAAFLEGKAEAALQARVESHVDRCASCADLLAALAVMYRDRLSESAPEDATHPGDPSLRPRSMEAPAAAAPEDDAHHPVRQRIRVLVLALAATHAVTAIWCVRIWLRGWNGLTATAVVTPAAHLALLILLNSVLALLLVLIVSVGRWWGTGALPSLVLVALSLPNPASFVLAIAGLWALTRTVPVAAARVVTLGLVGGSIPTYLVALGATAAVVLLPVGSGLESGFAGVLLTTLGLAVALALATVATLRRRHWGAGPLGSLFCGAAVASGVGSGFGLGVALLRVRRHGAR